MTQPSSESQRGYVLDASALLALLHREPGASVVETAMTSSVISSVNWSEVLQKAKARDVETEGVREGLEALGMSIIPFTTEDAEQAALLWNDTRRAGLSLGDRACVSLGLRLNLAVLTADKIWLTLQLGVDIQSIR